MWTTVNAGYFTTTLTDLLTTLGPLIAVGMAITAALRVFSKARK